MNKEALKRINTDPAVSVQARSMAGLLLKGHEDDEAVFLHSQHFGFDLSASTIWLVTTLSLATLIEDNMLNAVAEAEEYQHDNGGDHE